MPRKSHTGNRPVQADPAICVPVFHNIAKPMFICDSALSILEVNRAFLRLFPGERAGNACMKIFDKQEGDKLGLCLQAAFNTGTPQFCNISAVINGSKRRHFEVTASPILDSVAKEPSLIVHLRDLTSLRNLERELRASEERYRRIVETAREGIYIVDPDGRITFANSRFARMLRYDIEDIVGLSIFDLVDESALGLVRAKFERRRQGLSDTYEVTMKTRDGGHIHCLVAAAPMMQDGIYQGALGILTNITCLKEIQTALSAAKTFSERIINSITHSLIVVDPRTYRIVQANEPFSAKLRNRGLPEPTGRVCHEVVFGKHVPCHEEGVFCPIRKTFETGKPLLCNTVHPDLKESDRIIEIATYPVFDGEGKVDLVIRLERDVTEKKMLEKALALRSEELSRSERRLERIFELSREVSTKSSMAGLVQFLMEFAVQTLPGASPALFLLSASCDHFLPMVGCESKIVERLSHALQKLEMCGLSSDFVHHVKTLKSQDIIDSGQKTEISRILRIIADSDLSWFAIPLFVRSQCTGLLFIGSKTFNKYAHADIRFVEALFEQASGHLRNLAVHEAELSHLRSQVSERECYGGIIGQSSAMQEIYELIDLVAISDATVLITGENGTGKEMVAHAIHRQSHRRKGPFIVANCSAYPASLLESEIFGHERGAFTGAVHQKRGRIERAHGGTFFLDEIGEIAPSVQIFLLRFLQDHCFERVGGEKVIAADVRVLAATNRNLQQEVQAGRFRDDLYYRLNVIAINLPSLRDRKEDIPALAQHFLQKYNLKERKSIKGFSQGAMQTLMNHDWPGNVRQLENAISHAVVLGKADLVRKIHLPRFLWATEIRDMTILCENERLLIQRVLQQSNWNKHDAARRLKISRSTLYSKIQRYRIQEPVRENHSGTAET